MKRLAAFCLMLVVSLPAAAVEDGQVMYVGGTVPGLKLTFEYSGSKLEIPFAKIDSFEYSQEVARHLGVLPAIAVGLIRKRQRRHFFHISYHDESNASQVAVFEVLKQMPSTLLAILQNRTSQRCKRQPLVKCAQ